MKKNAFTGWMEVDVLLNLLPMECILFFFFIIFLAICKLIFYPRVKTISVGKGHIKV